MTAPDEDEEEFEDEPELDEDAIEEEDDLDEDLDADLDTDDDLAEVDVDALDTAPAADGEAAGDGAAKPARTTEGGEDEEEAVVELDDELHPADVEEPLDVLLQERTAAATLEDDEEAVEEEEVDTDEPGDAPGRILPRRPGEFLCQSCFLVLPRNQLADEKRMLCRDCA